MWPHSFYRLALSFFAKKRLLKPCAERIKCPRWSMGACRVRSALYPLNGYGQMFFGLLTVGWSGVAGFFGLSCDSLSLYFVILGVNKKKYELILHTFIFLLLIIVTCQMWTIFITCLRLRLCLRGLLFLYTTYLWVKFQC